MQVSTEPERKPELELLVEAWKTTIEVQQHFNEISMKIRAAFVTVVLALFAAEGFLFDKKFVIDALGLRISLTTVLPLIGIAGTYLFYFVDRYWYHQLLLGSVEHARKLEELYPQFPALGLTSAISRTSPVRPRSRLMRVAAYVFVRDERYRSKDDGRLHSDAKMEMFYKPVIAIFWVMFFVAIVAGGISFSRPEPVL